MRMGGHGNFGLGIRMGSLIVRTPGKGERAFRIISAQGAHRLKGFCEE